ncbi:MAG TPA: response regulator transcription factor [Desulfosporosinus sp.]|nr:response regulator transcription factor [Desulfosporosinus sp.]
MAKILIVEDDELLSRGIAFALEKEGYRVVTAYGYTEGYAAFLSGGVDLALLDINLPGKSGATLCSELRKTSKLPVIFITANDTEQDVIKGFQLGCDDYISKPFSLEVLKQRVKAVLRRVVVVDKNVFSSGNIMVDFQQMIVKKDADSVKLTVTEYRLLELLVRNKGQVLTRQLLLERLWDADGNFVEENALSVNIRRLRQKLEDDLKKPAYIITVFGIGYTWGDAG